MATAKKKSIIQKFNESVSKATGTGIKQPTEQQLIDTGGIKQPEQPNIPQDTIQRDKKGNPRKDIIFNADDSVTIRTPDGVSKTISRKDYNADIANQSGAMGGNTSRTASAGVNPDVLSELEQQRINSQENVKEADLISQEKALGVFNPQQLNPDMKKEGLDALDTTSILGGAVASGAIGAKIGAIGGTALTPGLGTAIGAVGGALVGAGSAFFFTQASDRKQAVKAGYAGFVQADKNMKLIINSVNAGKMSKASARLYWDNEYQRILQAQRNVAIQGEGLFGAKLSANVDELEKIDAWRRRYPQMNVDFELALMNPNPANLITDVDTSLFEGDNQ